MDTIWGKNIAKVALEERTFMGSFLNSKFVIFWLSIIAQYKQLFIGNFNAKEVRKLHTKWKMKTVSTENVKNVIDGGMENKICIKYRDFECDKCAVHLMANQFVRFNLRQVRKLSIT